MAHPTASQLALIGTIALLLAAALAWLIRRARAETARRVLAGKPRRWSAHEPSLDLAVEAGHGLDSGASVQILVVGYPTWLAITELAVHPDELLKATLSDGSAILMGKYAILSVRFGKVEED
jgi:hypothetical protein